MNSSGKRCMQMPPAASCAVYYKRFQLIQNFNQFCNKFFVLFVVKLHNYLDFSGAHLIKTFRANRSLSIRK